MTYRLTLRLKDGLRFVLTLVDAPDREPSPGTALPSTTRRSFPDRPSIPELEALGAQAFFDPVTDVDSLHVVVLQPPDWPLDPAFDASAMPGAASTRIAP